MGFRSTHMCPACAGHWACNDEQSGRHMVPAFMKFADEWLLSERTESAENVPRKATAIVRAEIMQGSEKY